MFIYNIKYRSILTAYLLAVVVSSCSNPPRILTSPANSTPVKIDTLVPAPLDIPANKTQGERSIVLAGGCFWGMEAVFEQLKGVKNVVSGYAGGTAATANYEAVSHGGTEHAESVKVTYDPQKISLGKILQVYFYVAHDPTQINRQYPDTGTQYRSAIFVANPEQQKVAEAYIDRLVGEASPLENRLHTFSEKIATKVVPLNKFYPAEPYHQNFIKNHPDYPYVVVHDLPKLTRLRQQFPELVLQ